jgi:hypothetical protein
MAKQPTFTALRNVLEQADHILATAPALPENRTAACRELLQTALALANDLKEQAAAAAIVMGRKGDKTTARRHGPEHYRMMASRRKTHGGYKRRSNTRPQYAAGAA